MKSSLVRCQSTPKGWKKYLLGELVTFLDSQRKPIAQKERKPGIYPYYGANGQQDSVDSYIFDEPLVLLAEDGGHFGNPDKSIAYQVSGKCWINNHAHVLRPSSLIDINFLTRYLEKFDVTQFITGTTRAKLTKTSAYRIPVNVPPVAEQKRIAEILDKADAVRRKRQEAIRLTEELLRSTFLEMFGDPVTNPKGWDVLEFQKLGTLDRGKSKHRPRNHPSLLGGKYPLIQTGDIANSGGVITSYHQTYSEKGLAQSKLWESGTLCITIAANIAQTGILSFDACFPDSIVGFKNNHLTNVEYIQQWLSFLQPLLEAKAPQVAQKNINLKILRSLKVSVPPIELQEKYKSCAVNIRESLIFQKKAANNQENLFNSLLQRAFRGEL